MDLPTRRTYRFPDERFTGSDWPTVYALAVRGPELSRRFGQLLQTLPDACGDAPGLQEDRSMDQWLSRLDRLVVANQEQAVWTARRIP